MEAREVPHPKNILGLVCGGGHLHHHRRQLRRPLLLRVFFKPMCEDLGWSRSVVSIARQCELLDLSRSSYYYAPGKDDSYNQLLMNRIDEQFTKMPFYGVPKMTAWLRIQGHPVNHKRIRRLMRLMGLETIYPKPKLSKANPEHKKYPYLLKNLVIDHLDQVWCADITYIRMLHGFIYLVAIMDWYSRYVLAWEISTTMEATFCISAPEQALELSSPEIFNTDQCVQLN